MSQKDRSGRPKAMPQIGPAEFLARVETAVRSASPLSIVTAMAETLDSLGYGAGIDRGRACLVSLWLKEDTHGTAPPVDQGSAAVGVPAAGQRKDG